MPRPRILPGPGPPEPPTASEVYLKLFTLFLLSSSSVIFISTIQALQVLLTCVSVATVNLPFLSTALSEQTAEGRKRPLVLLSGVGDGRCPVLWPVHLPELFLLGCVDLL